MFVLFCLVDLCYVCFVAVFSHWLLVWWCCLVWLCVFCVWLFRFVLFLLFDCGVYVFGVCVCLLFGFVVVFGVFVYLSCGDCVSVCVLLIVFVDVWVV